VGGRRGFTLVELLVVLAVIGVLLSVALPRYFGNIDRSKDAVLKENLHQMREAIQHYYADKGKYPERLDALAEHKYLRRIPVDPVTEKADTWIVVAPADNAAGGVYDVKSGAEGKTRDGVPYAEL
jgi:general secretion pathway protein G